MTAPKTRPTPAETTRRILRIAQDGLVRFPAQAALWREIIAEAEALLANDPVESTHRAAVAGSAETYRCAVPSCPGLPWRASDTRHPCIEEPKTYDSEATQALVALDPPDPK